MTVMKPRLGQTQTQVSVFDLVFACLCTLSTEPLKNNVLVTTWDFTAVRQSENFLSLIFTHTHKFDCD